MSLTALVQAMVMVAVVIGGAPSGVASLLPVLIAPGDGVATVVAIGRANQSTALGMLLKAVGLRIEIAIVALAAVFVGVVVMLRVHDIARERRSRRPKPPENPRPTTTQPPPGNPKPTDRRERAGDPSPARRGHAAGSDPETGLGPVDPLGAQVVIHAPAGTVGRARVAGRWRTARSTTGQLREGSTYRVIATDGDILVVAAAPPA